MLDTWVKLSDSLQTRDKIYRFIQYLSKFLYHYTKSRKLKNLISSIGQARKLYRAGKFLNFIQAIKTQTSNDDLLRFLSLARNSSLSLYFVHDFFVWLESVQLVQSKYDFKKIGSVFWLSGISFNIVACLYKIRVLNLDLEWIKKSKHAEKIIQLENDLHKMKFQIVQSCLDFLIPASVCGLLSLSDRTVGMAGSITSLMGLYALRK